MMSEQIANLDMEKINAGIADRSDVFYWQTDRAVEPEDAGHIWADRHRYFTDGELFETVNTVLGNGKLTRIEPLDLDVQTNLGNVNSVRVGTLASGKEVVIRCHPKGCQPELLQTMYYVEQNLPSIDENTIIIGHSSACPLILHLVQFFKITIKQIVLVGGFYKSLNDDGYSDLMLPKSFDWEAIKPKADEIIMINSDNDPWGCNDLQAREPAIKLSATLVVASGQGHMGSLSYKQPYKVFPLLKRLLRVSNK